MLASSQTITPRPAALPPAAQPAQPGGASAGGPSFAQFLNEQPALPPPPAHADAAPREPEAHEPAPPPSPATASPTARRQAAPAPAKPATAARGSAADAATPAKPETPSVVKDAADDKAGTTVLTADKADAPETAGLDEFTQLIGLAAPLAPTVTPAQVATTGSETTPATALPGAATPLIAAAAETTPAPGAAHAARAGRIDREEADDDARKPAAGGIELAANATVTERRPAEAAAREPAARAKLADASVATADKAGPRSTDVLQSVAEAHASSALHPAGSPEAGTPNFAAMLAQSLPTAGALPDAAPVSASGQVHAALHSSAFAPELAASVSLLAVDGVQQAELQLNPADMGPVAVQIVVDGSQAQVSFHAVQAETRQALEQSLPDLAAALQGQGLTLSGGGVFQQARRDTDHDQDRSDASGTARASRGGGDRIGATAASTAAPARRSVGLLDTFA